MLLDEVLNMACETVIQLGRLRDEDDQESASRIEILPNGSGLASSLTVPTVNPNTSSIKKKNHVVFARKFVNSISENKRRKSSFPTEPSTEIEEKQNYDEC